MTEALRHTRRLSPMRDPGTAHAFPKSESAPDRRDGGRASDLVLGAAPFLVCVDDDDGIATTLWELLLDEGIRALTFTGPVHAGAGDVTGFLHSEAPQVIIF